MSDNVSDAKPAVEAVPEQPAGEPPKPAQAEAKSAEPKSILPEETFKDPTEEYETPDSYPRTIQPREIETWAEALHKERLLVLRGLDLEVLLEAERAIADAEPFENFTLRSVCRPPIRPVLPESGEALASGGLGSAATKQNQRSSSDPFPPVEHLYDPRIGKGPLLIIAAVYDHPGAYGLTASLPRNPRDLAYAVAKLKEVNRYVLILTTPAQIEITPERANMKAFEHVAEFIYPLLAHLDPNDPSLPDKLTSQYQRGLWIDVVGNPKLDEGFYRQVISDKAQGILINLIREGETIAPPDGAQIDVRAVFAELAAKIRRVERKGGWPAKELFLEQTMLFVAAYLERLPAADFDRVVVQLLGSNTKRTQLTVRGVQRNDLITEVRVYQDVPLSTLWLEQRNSLLEKWGLRILILSGRPSVDCEGGASAIRQGFGAEFPFTHAELWKRAIDAGLLFDDSDQVAALWVEALVQRVADDPQGFGQIFLIEVLLCDSALGRFPGDLGERFEAAGPGRRVHVRRRVGDLLNILVRRALNDRVADALDQMISLGASGEVLTLLWTLETKDDFSVARLKIVRRILHQGGREHWKDARIILLRWAADAQGGPTLAAIAQWLPAAGSPQTNAPMVEAAGVLADLALRWFAAPADQPHRLADIAAGENNPADFIATLVKWLFHAYFEAACREREFNGFLSHWVLGGALADSHGQDREHLIAIYRGAIGVMQSEMAQIPFKPEAAPISQETAAVRECQAVILADWAGGLRRADEGDGFYGLLTGALAENAPTEAARQVRAALAAARVAADWIRSELASHTWESVRFRGIQIRAERLRNSINGLLKDWKFEAKVLRRLAEGEKA